MAESVRKSGRQRRSSHKYSFQTSDIDSDSGRDVVRTFVDDGEDDEFLLEEAADTPDEDDSIVDDAPNILGGVATLEEDSEDISLNGGDSDVSHDVEGDPLPMRKPSRGQQTGIAKYYVRKEKLEQDSNEHCRGLVEQAKQLHGKQGVLVQIFGLQKQDWVAALRSRDQWLTEPTLPKRKGDGKEAGGMCHFFSHTEEMRNMEAGVGWDWYYDQGGRKLFSERQDIRNLTADEGIAYIPKASKPNHKFLMGPYGKQKVFELPHLQSLFLDEAWGAPISTPDQHKLKEKKAKREGWMLNAGTSIRCLDWATNHDKTQYLAIATLIPNRSPPEFSKVSPAYTPSDPIRSGIQIWAFSVRMSSNFGFLDEEQRPELRLVLCTEWGDIKQLKWCPMPRLFRDETSPGIFSIGLLAGIWTDGYVRVLDVQMRNRNGSETSYVKYNVASFHARPPNTLCTCVTWLSASDVAVGCANGFLAVWDITRGGSEQQPRSSAPLTPSPWLYIFLHQSYILAISSAYPSSPHFLATSSMDGFMRLTDLRAPSVDYVLSQRSRIASSTIVFSDPLRSFISTEDNDYIRIYPLRCFHTSISFARTESFPLSLSVGCFHPYILVGCADGALVSTNPLRRILYRRLKQYQQTVFRHEWTRQRGGMSRLTEGYKVVNVTFMQQKTAAATEKDGVMISTIYEEEEGVAQVEWNPNLTCGAWIAAGMGSGLVRVQDLAI